MLCTKKLFIPTNLSQVFTFNDANYHLPFLKNNSVFTNTVNTN